MNERENRIARVVAHLHQCGVAFELRRLNATTATAELAAAALGCAVAEIAKSIVFRARADGGAVICVLCGDDRVDVKKVRAIIGGAAEKADADFVKAQCGFEIGGVAPVAHRHPARVLLDARLRRFSLIWAAAGSAHAVFSIRPDELATAADANFVNIAV